jgi:hypothetical protein
MQILFYHAKKNIFDKLVRTFTKSDYSHVELRFSDGMCFSSSPRDGGTRFKKIDIDDKNWHIIDLYNVSKDTENKIRNLANEMVNKKYDWLGVLGFVIPLFPSDENRWYCSEICAYLLDKANVIICYHKISPEGLNYIIKRFYNVK